MSRRSCSSLVLFALALACSGEGEGKRPDGKSPVERVGEKAVEKGDAAEAGADAKTPPDTKTAAGPDAGSVVVTPPVDPAPIAETTPHPFDARDLLAMDRVSDPRASKDGITLAFVRRVTDLDANKGRTDIWTVPSAGGDLKRMTDHAEADTDPRWGPDGTLYFLSRRSGSSQVWKIGGAGGEPTQVTDLPLDVGALAVSPDGANLAIAVEVFVDCVGKDLGCTKERLDAREKASSGRLYERLFMRHWDAWKDGRRSHLFVVPAAGGTPVDVTAELDADVPGKPFGGIEEWAFSPDGKTLVYTAREAGTSEAWSTDFDLYAVGIDGSDRKNLTDANPAWDAAPAFSPDGKTLVWKAMARPGYEADRFVLMKMDWPGGTAQPVTQTWDRSVGSIAFVADGQSVVVTAEDTGRQLLFVVPLGGGEPRALTSSGTSDAPVIVGDRVAFLHDHLRQPAELASVPVAGGEMTPITRINDTKVAAAHMGEPEQFRFKGAKGDTVHGWLVKPVDFDATKTYPVAFLIHGGPQGSFGDHFHYRWNPQVYAGAGWVAVMIDFHGSTGYGQAFTDAIRKDWGGKPLEDLEKGLAHVRKTSSFVDPKRACALGASYGGFMINWIAGRWPDGFDCLVNHDGLFDARSMYYSTEELWFPEWEHGGMPYYAAPKVHEKFNPAQHVIKWKTPMLVVHGGLDYRVPDTQGIATFTALQRRGVESRFLHFPDENHWVLKPKNSLLWHETVLAWLEGHRKG